MKTFNYWKNFATKFYKHKLGRFSFFIVLLFCLLGIYAPFLASSKPFFVIFNGKPFFPLFAYLFYEGFFTKWLDLFFNILIFTLPLFLIFKFFYRRHSLTTFFSFVLLQFLLFIAILVFPIKNPAANPYISQKSPNTWANELKNLSTYQQLNLLLTYRLQREQQERLSVYQPIFTKETGQKDLPTLYQVALNHEKRQIEQLEALLSDDNASKEKKEQARIDLAYIVDKREWLIEESQNLQYLFMPPLSHFHWEDDAGGSQLFNKFLPWWDLTRINRKSLLSALIFGVRISLVVGITAVFLSLIIGIPVGALAGFYGGKVDILISRLLEIWEAMPTFFMLLMVIAILQSKSIFLVISIIGFFGWTSFSRFIRGEFFKQRSLSYVEAGRALGFKNDTLIFKHILPNAIPPVLTLLPFAVMSAITSEAGLSFLGLGEEGSCSWGVLMDEGRGAFPDEAYLLWPPAILLTVLLIAIALVGDALRDTLDPKS